MVRPAGLHTGDEIQRRELNDSLLYQTSANEVQAVASNWDDRRFKNILSRLLGFFPHINTQRFTASSARLPMAHATISAQREKSLWEKAWSAAKNFVLPPQNSDFYDDQRIILKEIQDINDPRFIGALMGIADYDLKIGDPEFYDIYVLEAVDRAVASLVPSLDVDQLIKLKRQTDMRLENVRAYWRKHRKDRGLERFAESHIKRLERLRDSAQTRIAGRLRRDSTVHSSSDSRYIPAHYRYAVSELARTPIKVSRGFDDLLRNSNPVNIVPRFVVGAAYAVWRGVTDIPFELGGVATAGAYGLYGGELGGSVANTALIAAPVVKFARGMTTTRIVEPAISRQIKFVDITDPVIIPPASVRIPSGGFFVPSRGPAYSAASGGLVVRSGAEAGTWIMPFETPRPASWSFQPPPRVMTRARNLPDETPLIFPGIPAAVVNDPRPARDELIVLPGAENRTETIGDPEINQQQIGDRPPREDEQMFAGKRKRKKTGKSDQDTMPASPAPNASPAEGEELLEFGDKEYKEWHEIYVRNTTEKVKVTEAMGGVIAALPSRRSFLDVGAGDGDLTFRISQGFSRTVVVEPNAKMREAFESRGVEFIGDYFERADLGDSRFDLILCSQVFWLVRREDQVAFIQKMYDHLAPGGKLVVIMVSPLGQSHDFYKRFFYGYNTTTHSILGDLHVMGLPAQVIPISFEFGTDSFEDFYSILRLFSVESWLHPVNVSDSRIREDIGDVREYTARKLREIREYITRNNHQDGRYKMGEEIDVIVVTRP